MAGGVDIPAPAVAGGVDIAVIAAGGGELGGDALDAMRAGAAAVAVGTESFRDPRVGARIATELAALAAKSGLSRIGSALTC